VTHIAIIGGGLAGLAAAYELEQHHIPYTLIEMKGRLGGSIASERRDGFTVDTGVMAIPGTGDWPFLAELGLSDALFPLPDQPGGTHVAFRQGTQTLVDGLAKHLTGNIMVKMAVSSLGYMDKQYTICLENGLMLTASALIVAAPARYAERMFRSLQPEISQRLSNYCYDTIMRVSLGYRCQDMKFPLDPPWDMAIASAHWTDHPSRVPPEQVLIQLGIRIPPHRMTPESLLATLQAQLGWPPPVMNYVSHWPEADPLAWMLPGYRQNMEAIERLLPDGVALVGSDYRALRFDERLEQGREAARKVGDWLAQK
jgi:protoporphyrinogen oxidase